ncbi:hypothetical protein NQ317_013887 [Molorchus minor]|uniref:Uncharacterized protein n=1 Tax=Molorchus minor TaxID=1323400 RepID=A0ABQ9K8P4_9CUCU|nr:hypothetical protein NQ317_013887 [Molorchus minor]
MTVAEESLLLYPRFIYIKSTVKWCDFRHQMVLFCACLPTNSFAVWALDSPQNGLGPINGAFAPSFARRSAISLPYNMPSCPGTQFRVKLLFPASCFRVCLQSHAILTQKYMTVEPLELPDSEKFAFTKSEEYLLLSPFFLLYLIACVEFVSEL